MKKYLYRVDITPLTDKEGNAPTNPQSIAFDFRVMMNCMGYWLKWVSSKV